MAAALILLAVAGCRGEPQPRVVILGIDGLDPVALETLIDEGVLPNFERLRDEGAWGDLASSTPRLSPILWTTIATGQPMDRHGIGGFSVANAATGEQFPVTSRMRRVEALWNIASSEGLRVGVVGWWATWPAEPVNGWVVSDHLCYHFLFPQGLQGGRTADGLTHPPELADEVGPLVFRPADVDLKTTSRFIQVGPADLEREFRFDDEVGHFRWILATTETYRRVGHTIWDRQPDLLMVYFEGVDSASHLFGHLFRAEGLAGELAEQQRRFGSAVEEMYRLADEIVGEYLARLDERTSLMVLSDHGFTLGVLHDDPRVTRDMRRVSPKFHRPNGVIGLIGNGVHRGSAILDARQLDVAPTVLRLLGLQASDEMPGRVLEEALDGVPPAGRRATYEKGRPDRGTAATTDAEVDPAILQRLEALGYMDEGVQQPSLDHREAAQIFKAGRYDEAVLTFAKMVDKDPDNPRLRISLAGALGAVGRLDEAMEHLDAAIHIAPLLPEAYHNRAVISERTGDTEAAVADYRRALSYAPDFDPSREALIRLTETSGAATAVGPDEIEALRLIRRAELAARSGDYDLAMRLLDEARTLAPRLAVVHQYRSNVAYLRGDLEAALEAVETALDLEPDNDLYRVNADRLREEMQ